MTSGQPTKMTLLYVTNTGHVLAAVTRTNSNGPAPSAADLAGDGVIVQGLVTDSTATPWTTSADAFLVPAKDLSTLDIDVDSTTGPALKNPRSFGVALVAAAAGGNPAPTNPPALNPLNPIGATAASIDATLKLTLTFPTAPATGQYYALVTSQVALPDTIPVVLNSFQGSIPSGGGGTVTQNVAATSGSKYSVLFLVETLAAAVWHTP
jgi:hypothetical protein